MEQLKEYARQHQDGLITAGEMLYKSMTYLNEQTISIETTRHKLVDDLCDQLLKE